MPSSGPPLFGPPCVMHKYVVSFVGVFVVGSLVGTLVVGFVVGLLVDIMSAYTEQALKSANDK